MDGWMDVQAARSGHGWTAAERSEVTEGKEALVGVFVLKQRRVRALLPESEWASESRRERRRGWR